MSLFDSASSCRFKDGIVDFWACYLLTDGSVLTSTEAGALKKLPGTNVDVKCNSAAMAPQSFVYARIVVSNSGVEDLNLSAETKITF